MQLAEQAWDAGKKERNMVVKLSIFVGKSVKEGSLPPGRRSDREKAPSSATKHH